MASAITVSGVIQKNNNHTNPLFLLTYILTTNEDLHMTFLKKQSIKQTASKTADHSVSNNQITEGVIWKQLLIFFFPILFGTFFQQLYNTADAMVVGRFVGKEALACVGGSSSQIINLIVGFFVGLSSGATVIIAQYYGARDEKNLQDTLHTAIAFSIVGSFVISILGIVLSPIILRLMNTPEYLMADSLLYLRFYCS